MPMKFYRSLLPVLLAACCWPALAPLRAADAAPSTPPPSARFQVHDRWCVVGDSITHSGTYHEWIELFYITRAPDVALEVFNCGISGDRAAGGLQRLNWDILDKKPTVASVMFGMNDVERALYTDEPATPEIVEKRHAALDRYQQNMRALVAALQQAGVRVILIAPSIFDQTAEMAAPKQTGVNDALGECADFVHRLGAETGCAVVDFYRAMNLFTQAKQAKDPKFTMVGPDRIHPGPAGHLALAYLFLKAQGVPPDVSRLAIDATGAVKVTGSAHGTATNVRRQGTGIAFTWAEKALPFPIDPDCAPALQWVSFNADLNREVLQVAGLKPGRYTLGIDGVEIRTYSADELARGVNLAEQTNTPQYQQAIEVLHVMNTRTKLVATMLRSLAHVEHQSAPDIAHPVTLEQMKPYLEKRLAQFKINPPAASTRMEVERYATIKLQEPNSIAEAARLAVEARRVATPRPHDFVLTAAAN
jgi:lysophospholipase L1-like esterase